MDKTGNRKIQVSLMPGRKLDSAWDKLWDLILRPIQPEQPRQLRFDLGERLIHDQKKEAKHKERNKTKPKKKEQSPQLCLWDLDKFKRER